MKTNFQGRVVDPQAAAEYLN